MNPGVMMSTDESAWSLSLFQNVTLSLEHQFEKRTKNILVCWSCDVKILFILHLGCVNAQCA